MRYIMQQRLVRLWKPTAITDETGAVAFHVEPAQGNTWAMYDPDGNGVAQVQQKAWQGIKKTYVISRPDHAFEDLAVRKQVTLFRQRYEIAIPGGDPWVLTGKPLNHEFTLTRNGATVATATRSWTVISHGQYGVEMAAGEDPVLVLACVVALELTEDRL
jgi:uncharacterized protein YxjI